MQRRARKPTSAMAALWDKLTGRSSSKDERPPAERHRSFEGELHRIDREELYAVPRPPPPTEKPALKGYMRSDSTLRDIVESDLRQKKLEQQLESTFLATFEKLLLLER